MYYILILLFGILCGYIIRSIHLGRYFALCFKTAIEFGGSNDEIRVFKVALEASVKHIPFYIRKLLWIKNG